MKRGIALTPVKFGISFTLTHMNQAGALVHVYQDGSVHLNHGGTEMGQGLYIKVAQVVAEEFGIGMERVRITATTTAKVPNTSPTAASSGSDLNGMAARIAARRDQGAAWPPMRPRRFGVPEDQIAVPRRPRLRRQREPVLRRTGEEVRARRASSSRRRAIYKTPKITWDRAKGTGPPVLLFRLRRGLLRSDRRHAHRREPGARASTSCTMSARSLNPAIDIGQIEGGFVQGMGWLTTEELVFDAEGRLLTHAPSTYKIPVASDVPADFRVALYPNANREETIYRSKAVGEPPIMLANSVFCALADAIHALDPVQSGPARCAGDAGGDPARLRGAARAADGA